MAVGKSQTYDQHHHCAQQHPIQIQHPVEPCRATLENHNPLTKKMRLCYAFSKRIVQHIKIHRGIQCIQVSYLRVNSFFIKLFCF